jgi:hypothetical protein
MNHIRPRRKLEDVCEATYFVRVNTISNLHERLGLYISHVRDLLSKDSFRVIHFQCTLEKQS